MLPPTDSTPDDDGLLATVAGAHTAVAEHALATVSPAPPGESMPRDFGYVAVQEYYEEPWIVDLRTSIARLFFCTYAKANRTVRGKRAGNPHRVCIHVTVGRRVNATAADMVAAAVVDAIRRRAHRDARQALEDARNRSVDEPDTRTWSHGAKREAGKRIVDAIDRMADEAAITQARLQPIYALDARLADLYVATELDGRQTLSAKKLKVAVAA